jgi:hypothetical protein
VDGLGGSDLVILPLFDESQSQGFSLAGVQESHPVVEFEGRRSRALIAGGDQPVFRVAEFNVGGDDLLLTAI